MAECELLSGCIFFNDKMLNMPGLSEMYKNQFCRQDYSKCARYMVYKELGKENVPLDLFPNQKERAEKILSVNE